MKSKLNLDRVINHLTHEYGTKNSNKSVSKKN